MLFFANGRLFAWATLPKKGRTSASITKAWPTIMATRKARNIAPKVSEKSVVMSTSTNPQSPIFFGVGKLPLGSIERAAIFAPQYGQERFILSIV
jgi:hypothetical protein